MTHKISVLSDIHLLPDAQKQIQALSGASVAFPEDNPTTEQELVARTRDAEAVLVSPGTKITASYLDACPSVKYVGLCGTSTANIDLEELSKRGIVFKNVIDYGDEPTAEFIFMQLATLVRGIGKYQWRDMPCELMGKTIGIIGLGALGKSIAHLALAYKMQTNYYSTHRKPEWEDRGAGYKELRDLLSTSEIIVISTPTNVKILGDKEFALLKSGTILVQASMGDIFDKDAFLNWIAKQGNYALFDYSAGEKNYQAYKDLPQVIFPKIIAGHTRETKERLGQKVVENLRSYFEENYVK
jgi:phosphoglycerate dehydrogenase-like enzyme